MNEAKLYYTAPSDEIFNEVKKASMDLWTERYPEATSPYYAKEKTDRIKDWQNVGDNVMSLVAMFDSENHRLLAEKLSEEARTAIRERMIDGGNPSYLIPSMNDVYQNIKKLDENIAMYKAMVDADLKIAEEFFTN